MLYIFNEKIYVKPFDNKIVEVTITKTGNEYDVKAIKAPVELNDMKLKELASISLEEAYKHQNREVKRTIIDK